MDRRPFGVAPQYSQSAANSGGYYNQHYDYYPPRQFWNGHPQPPPDTRWLSNPAPPPPPIPPTPPHYSHEWRYGAGMPMPARYVDPRYSMIPHHSGQTPHRASYPAQPVLDSTQRQESYHTHPDYFQDPFKDQGRRQPHARHARHASTALQQDRYLETPDQSAGRGSAHESVNQPIVSPRSYRLVSPKIPWDTDRERRTSSFLEEYNKGSEATSPSLGMASDIALDQPSGNSSSAHCGLCDRVGHLSHNCRLAQWDESPLETRADTPCSEYAVEIEKQEKYERLAGKLSHICWNMIPDPEQPPESHKTMIQHILRLLSQNPDNVEIVYNHMFGEEFQHKWLCLKAMCDPEWQGAVWLVDGACRYCSSPSRPDMVTLCYRIQPNRNCNALYREVGVVRA